MPKPISGRVLCCTSTIKQSDENDVHIPTSPPCEEDFICRLNQYEEQGSSPELTEFSDDVDWGYPLDQLQTLVWTCRDNTWL